MTDFFTELFEKPGRPKTHFGACMTPEEKECPELDESTQDKNSSTDNE